MHAAQIQADLKIAGYTQARLAEELRLAANSVGYVIHGRSRSHRVETRIAAVIGKAPVEIWPQWYGQDGKPLRKRRSPVRAADLAARLQAKAAASGAR